jgi:hypothetical protein
LRCSAIFNAATTTSAGTSRANVLTIVEKRFATFGEHLQPNTIELNV